MPFTPIAGVPAAPPTSGLVAAADKPPPPERWEDGVAWVPERCGTTYQLVPWCASPVDGYVPPRPGSAYSMPVPVRIADECSTLGGKPDLDRAKRVAEAQLPWITARELWTGAGSAADPYTAPDGSTSNPHLASPEADIIGGAGGPTGAMLALGRLEAAALEASHGQPVMLHVPVAASWEIGAVLFKDGNQLLTATGNQVVIDGGYPGTGPNGEPASATVWAYATTPVAVLTSPWTFVTDDAQTVDRAKNTRTTWASAVFAALFDPCVHLATEITL